MKVKNMANKLYYKRRNYNIETYSSSLILLGILR